MNRHGWRTTALVALAALGAITFGLRPAAAGPSSDRFRPSSRNPLAGGDAEDDALSTPEDFENAAALHPSPGNLIYVSRCRFAPFKSPTVYAPLGAPVADAVVGDGQFPLANNTSCYDPQNETPAVVNPVDPRNVATSANEYRLDGHEVYTSTDGGRTWRNVVVPGMTGATGGLGPFAHMSSCGDPSLAFGPDGTLYYAGLVCSFSADQPAALGYVSSGIGVSASRDGGATWGTPHLVTSSSGAPNFNDKEWITAGPDGRLYVTWTRFAFSRASGYQGSPILLAVSADGGVSWSDPRPVSDSAHPYDQGSIPRVGRDGTLYVAYEAATPASGYLGDALLVARSSDGGRSFTNTELARVFDDANCYPLNVTQDRQTLSGEQFRLNSYPSFAIDGSTGALSIAWADDQANRGCGYEKGGSFQGATANQVKLVTSADGSAWSAPRVITDGASDKVFPAVSAGGSRTTVSYYTRGYSPNTDLCKAMQLDLDTGAFVLLPGAVCMDYASRSSADGYRKETRLTTQSSNPYITFAGSFIGDYTGADVAADGTTFAAWTDFRGNPGVTAPNQDVDVARGAG
ncbi:MAG TPA: sialidase family protein [Solirubrobacterales bacterium]|nr:sialidase family protein [Solirubrobacterales bacterium]